MSKKSSGPVSENEDDPLAQFPATDSDSNPLGPYTSDEDALRVGEQLADQTHRIAVLRRMAWSATKISRNQLHRAYRHGDECPTRRPPWNPNGSLKQDENAATLVDPFCVDECVILVDTLVFEGWETSKGHRASLLEKVFEPAIIGSPKPAGALQRTIERMAIDYEAFLRGSRAEQVYTQPKVSAGKWEFDDPELSDVWAFILTYVGGLVAHREGLVPYVQERAGAVLGVAWLDAECKERIAAVRAKVGEKVWSTKVEVPFDTRKDGPPPVSTETVLGGGQSFTVGSFLANTEADADEWPAEKEDVIEIIRELRNGTMELDDQAVDSVAARVATLQGRTPSPEDRRRILRLLNSDILDRDSYA